MIDAHTLNILEFPKVISLIAGKCVTPFGHDVVEEFKPLYDPEPINRLQIEISQMKDIINFGTAFPISRMEDCRDEIEKSTVEGLFLHPEEILHVLELIEISISLNNYDQDERHKFPKIAEYLTKIRAYPEIKKEIRKAIDEDGNIKDSASPQLKHIRMDLQATRQKLMARLQGILAGQNKQAGWQDDIITQRNGRYVIPVMANQYRSDFGILHDRSQSGATVYVEPQETVEQNNKLNLLKQQERIEMDRILRALTSEIGRRAQSLEENIRLIGILDSRYAAAQFARLVKANRPVIEGSASFELKDARHPLLITHFKDAGEVVPLDLDLGENRQAILVTGPNTGGKTIALKTIGLLLLMAQSGLPVPADEKSRIGLFDKIYADIGDEQSIELSLSTFSSHVKNIIRAMGNVGEDSLVLFDEIGAGTDPKEGASLAEAIILYLLAKQARIVVTTHYSQLKTLPLEHPEIENASLEFDRKTLAPTFKLQLGIPGSSYAVEIASRLGMPDDICDHASNLLGKSERSLSDLIASLEAELASVRKDKTELTERLEKARELENYYKSQTENLKNEIEEARENALNEIETYIKTTRAEMERQVADIRATQADKKTLKNFHSTVQSAQNKLHQQRQKLNEEKVRTSPHARYRKGDRVKIISFNQEGEIEEKLDKERYRVRVGNVSTVVEMRNLEKIENDTSSATKKKNIVRTDTDEVLSPEIHLRGMTVEEALEALERFIDRAVISGLSQIYVIHGKGTGKLRKGLTQYLNQHPEVASVRMGNWNEGGAGVTIVKLKE